ncbi:bifunctional chorismate synthase/riboflavin reductase [NAD(P)H] ARO2 [Ascoidea rubescens DSM 1968]|uniref:Chorismate synthase n=1 Tax=Ascoidea rubescens DSM 1968 TaxID=1344418 RepID=A0A1D2VAE9_9ASCO|nr:chorismate synthase [Ascoidea rubescens DSM 1968]ODV58591.1 chorismate synthase [Ascoidea rubescens DSM 1968]
MSTFGTLFKVTTYGESHCPSVGCIVEGVPGGMNLDASDIQPQLDRRRPGQSKLSTPRKEDDKVVIHSGLENGRTLGTPIAMIVKNKDHHPQDYSETDFYPRPSHSDLTYLLKYGIKAASGGGRSSARETIGRVAAGAIAERFLKLANNVEIVAFVSSVGKISIDKNPSSPYFQNLLNTITREQVDQFNPIRCPHKDIAEQQIKLTESVKAQRDSIGGVVTCVIRNVPKALGEPCFDKLEAMLAHAMLSIPATKGFEIGSGFYGTTLKGSEHNDMFSKNTDSNDPNDKYNLKTLTNFSGGIQGGISNGEHIYFNVAFKPPATISQPQETATYDGAPGVLKARGRHDPNVVPRAVPIVEAMAALVLADALLIQKSREYAHSIVDFSKVF